MTRSLYVKFLLAYVIFGLLSFAVISTLISEQTLRHLTEEKAEDLYREAHYISANFVESYDEGEGTTPESIHAQFEALGSYLQASLWLIDADGTIVLDSTAPLSSDNTRIIPDFDPTDLGSSYYMIGDFYGTFEEKTLSVVAPVTYNYKTNGYVILHTPYHNLELDRDGVIGMTYLAMLIILFLSLLILLVFTIFVYYPIRNITEAANQYAQGNFKHTISISSRDEIGRLADTMNYMAKELSDMDEYQKKFVANISHDFRSPLTSIKGYLEAIEDGTIPPELQGKYIGIVLRETERLTKLTSGLLALNSLDTKQSRLDITTFDINAVIKNTASTFEGVCTQKRITLDLIFETKQQPVSADMGKIQQVLYNLLDNAIKFSPNNSKITLETSTKREKVFVSVKDNGIGIPRESQKKIWERFYKIDASRGKDKKGTGLGLSIVKEIIASHEEHINVISTEGVGTEFLFTLPRADSEEV